VWGGKHAAVSNHSGEACRYPLIRGEPCGHLAQGRDELLGPQRVRGRDPDRLVQQLALPGQDGRFETGPADVERKSPWQARSSSGGGGGRRVNADWATRLGALCGGAGSGALSRSRLGALSRTRLGALSCRRSGGLFGGTRSGGLFGGTRSGGVFGGTRSGSRFGTGTRRGGRLPSGFGARPARSCWGRRHGRYSTRV
jgi:hypothetical protein